MHQATTPIPSDTAIPGDTPVSAMVKTDAEKAMLKEKEEKEENEKKEEGPTEWELIVEGDEEVADKLEWEKIFSKEEKPQGGRYI